MAQARAYQVLLVGAIVAVVTGAGMGLLPVEARSVAERHLLQTTIPASSCSVVGPLPDGSSGVELDCNDQGGDSVPACCTGLGKSSSDTCSANNDASGGTCDSTNYLGCCSSQAAG